MIKIKRLFFILILSISLAMLCIVCSYAYSSQKINIINKIDYLGKPGSKENPFLINSISDYNLLTSKHSNNPSIYLKQTTNLVESQTSKINQVTNFNANYNGNNHSITLNHNLFNSASGYIENLKLVFNSNLSLNNTNPFGILANKFNGTLNNCEISGTTNISNIQYFGGLIGSTIEKPNQPVKIENCKSNLNITINTPSQKIGGLIGINNSNELLLNSCSNTGNISVNKNNQPSTKTLYLGGLIGHISKQSAKTTVKNSYNSGSLLGVVNYTSTYSRVGGLIGGATTSTETNIASSFSTGEITSIANLDSYGAQSGGLISYLFTELNYLPSKLNISNCYSTAKLSANSNNETILGGLVAMGYSKEPNESTYSHIKIENSHFSGNILTNPQTNQSKKLIIGGIIGQGSKIKVFNSFSNANITSTSETYQQFIGGIIGNSITSSITTEILNSISNCIFTYSTLPNSIGGLIGNHSGKINTLKILNSSFLKSTQHNHSCSSAIGNNSITTNFTTTPHKEIFEENSLFFTNKQSPWDFKNIWIFKDNIPTLRHF